MSASSTLTSGIYLPMSRFARLAVLVVCTAMSGVLVQGQKSSPAGHYLFAWTGDAANKGNDFLAVIDADPMSPNYGHLVTTLATDQKTALVHHTEYTMP